MKFQHWLTLLSIIIALVLLWSLKEVFIQIFAAIVIAMALCTLTGKLTKLLSIPRVFALLITISSLLIITSASLVIVVPQFTEELQLLITQLPSAAKELWEISLKSISNLSIIIYGESVGENIDRKLLSNFITTFPDGPTLANGVADSLSKIVGLASNLGIGIIQLLFVIAVSLMISFQPISYRESLIRLVPSFYRRRARSILIMCGEALSNWMFGVVISSSFVILLAGIGLYLLGVKLVIANAFLAGILNVIPNIGPTLSTIFPMSVALLDTPWKSLAVLGLYIIIQNLESYIITPSIMHKQVNLLPGVSLTAQLIFTIIFGPIGLLLALPLAIISQVLVREIIVIDILDKAVVNKKPSN